MVVRLDDIRLISVLHDPLTCTVEAQLFSHRHYSCSHASKSDPTSVALDPSKRQKTKYLQMDAST